MATELTLTLNINRYQRELLEEALEDYMTPAEGDEDWVEPVTDILRQVKDVPTCSFADSVAHPAT